MKEIWNEVLFVDCLIAEEWTAFFIGDPEAVKKEVEEMAAQEPKMIAMILNSFEVE